MCVVRRRSFFQRDICREVRGMMSKSRRAGMAIVVFDQGVVSGIWLSRIMKVAQKNREGG